MCCIAAYVESKPCIEGAGDLHMSSMQLVKRRIGFLPFRSSGNSALSLISEGHEFLRSNHVLLFYLVKHPQQSTIVDVIKLLLTKRQLQGTLSGH